MPYATYRLSDNRFLYVCPQRPDFDSATEGVQEFLEHLRPNMKTDRYDQTSPTKKRAATVQEMADYDTERRANGAQRLIESDPMLVALAEVVRREINLIRSTLPAPLPVRTKQDVLDQFKAVYPAVLEQLNSK